MPGLPTAMLLLDPEAWGGLNRGGPSAVSELLRLLCLRTTTGSPLRTLALGISDPLCVHAGAKERVPVSVLGHLLPS